MKHLGDQCSCINEQAKQAIEFALDYHIIHILREIRGKQELLKEAKQEFEKITGSKPGRYGVEDTIDRLQKDYRLYSEIRAEIIKTPECSRPAFEEVQP